MEKEASSGAEKASLELINSATDKEHHFRTVLFPIDHAANQHAVYVPCEKITETIAERTNDAKEVVLRLVVNMAKNRGERPGELIALTACLNDNFFGDGTEDMSLIPEMKRATIDSLMQSNPGFNSTIDEALKGIAFEIKMEPAELMRRYGVQKAKETIRASGMDRNILKQQILNDINGEELPVKRRIRAESEVRESMIEKELEGLRERQTPQRDVEIPVPDREELVRKLAESMGVNWSDVPDEDKQRLLALDATSVYVEIAKISPKGRAGAEAMRTLEEEHARVLARLKNDN